MQPPATPQPGTASAAPPPAGRSRRATVNPAAAVVAAGSAAALIAGSFLRWPVVRFDGVVIRELSRTGWGEGDGKITVLIGIGGLIAAALVVGGVGERWLKLGLLVAGGVAIVDCVLAFLDATADDKPQRIADALGIAARGITDDAGPGLFVTALAGLGLAVAGVLLDRPEPVA
jgi:hypothetical protein